MPKSLHLLSRLVRWAGEERIKCCFRRVSSSSRNRFTRPITFRVLLLLFFISYRLSFSLLSPSSSFRPIVFLVFRTTHRHLTLWIHVGQVDRRRSVDDSTCTRYQILSIPHDTGVFRCMNRKRY